MEGSGVAVSVSNMAKKGKSESVISWADLPSDIVDAIAERLCNLEFFALRQVCSSWSRSVSFPRKKLLSLSLPITVPPLKSSLWDFGWRKGSIPDWVLSTGSVYALCAPSNSSSSSSSLSPECFLLFAEEFAEGKLWLRNPLSGFLVSDLPYHLPDKFNLLDFGAVEIAKCYSVSSSPRLTKGTPPYNLIQQFLKVVLTSDGFSALVLEDTGVLRVLNTREQEWGIIHGGKGYKFDDIVEHEGKVFGVDRRAKLYSIEYNGVLWEMTVVGRRISVGGPGGGRRKRLVVSSGDLYLLVRSEDKTLKIFKLKLADRRWVRETNLVDQIFYVGSNMSFSISTQVLGGNCRSSILFTKDSFPCYQSMGNHYSYRRQIDELEAFCFDEAEGAGLVAASAYTSIFWPPPIWLHLKLKPVDILHRGSLKVFSRIEETFDNPCQTGYLKQQLHEYKQFFQAVESLYVSEVMAAKQSLLNACTNFQDKDKVEDVNYTRVQENYQMLADEALADFVRKQCGVLYTHVEQAILRFEDRVHK